MVHLTAKTKTELKQILDELTQNIIPIFDNKRSVLWVNVIPVTEDDVLQEQKARIIRA